MIRFNVMGVTVDRRTPDLKARYASILAYKAQEAADNAIEAEWRARVRANEERRFFERVRQARLLALEPPRFR